MILIYSNISTARLQYICKFIFAEQLGITYTITIDEDGFNQHDGPKINYSNKVTEGNSFTLVNHPLLFETGIRLQETTCFDTSGSKAFFKSTGGDFSFDLFAAAFYLLTRYEEYLPHGKDSYGRFAHENALAYKEGFLNSPVINKWILSFADALKNKFPVLSFKFPVFEFIPTYDIDIAYSYKGKGMMRNIGGFIKKPSLERIRVLAGLQKDPFNSYAFLDALHEKLNMNPVYFFLVAIKNSIYDKNISPYTNAMWQLMKKHAEKYSIGLHPSWKSNENITILNKEKKILEAATKTEILLSRQHYIKFNLPQTFDNLLEAGIKADFSMGYGSINGFRASIATPFFWYSLKDEQVTPLKLYPFCYMDANSHYEQKYTAEQAFEELAHYHATCKQVNGCLVTIFHNNFLGTDPSFAGWQELYDRFISQVQQ